MRRSACAVAALVAAAFCAVPTHATAQQMNQPLNGLTAQDRTVTMSLTPSGRIAAFDIPWKTDRCERHDKATVTGDTSGGGPGASVSTPRRFVERFRIVDRDRGGLRSVLRIEVRARRAAHAERWRGTIAATSVVSKHGRPYDRCVLVPTRWTAARASGSLQLAIETSHVVGQDAPVDFRSPRVPVTSVPLRSVLDIQFDTVDIGRLPWTVTLRPRWRRGVHWHRGRFRGDVLDVIGDGSSCDTPVDTEVDIRKLRLDARGYVRSITADLSQRCDGNGNWTHGRLVFDRGF